MTNLNSCLYVSRRNISMSNTTKTKEVYKSSTITVIITTIMSETPRSDSNVCYYQNLNLCPSFETPGCKDLVF